MCFTGSATTVRVAEVQATRISWAWPAMLERASDTASTAAHAPIGCRTALYHTTYLLIPGCGRHPGESTHSIHHRPRREGGCGDVEEVWRGRGPPPRAGYSGMALIRFMI